MKPMSAKLIAKRAMGIAKKSVKIRDDIHKLAIETLKHVEAHGDTTPARDLQMTLVSNGVPCVGLLQWLQTHGQMKGTLPEPTTKNKSPKPVFKRNKNAKPIDFDEANANPFWQKSQEKAEKYGKKDAKPSKPLSNRLTSVYTALEKIEKETADMPNLSVRAAINNLKTAITTAENLETVEKNKAVNH